MTFDDFQRSLRTPGATPPAAPATLRALWLAAHGDWDAAHTVAQEIKSRDGSWIHAHLHREEGDLGNAGYWYDRAGQPVPDVSVAAEREALIHHFLREPPA